MIAKITKGAHVYGLVAYLWGPGRHDEHLAPRVLTSSRGMRFEAYDDDASRADALSVWSDTLEVKPKKHVWHCSLRVADDESLSPEQWAAIAKDVVAAAGISAGVDDPSGCHWVAMSHDGDHGNHIHIAAVLVRPDGSSAFPWKDREKVGSVCRSYESKFSLTRTAERNGNAHPAKSKAEFHRQMHPEGLDKAGVRRIALEAAAASSSWSEYRDQLVAAGLEVHVRYSTIDQEMVTGYSITIPRTGVAEGGGRIGRGLSYPKLTEAWTGLSHGEHVANELRGLREQRNGTQQDVADALMRAAHFDPEADKILGGSGELDADRADALGTVLQVGIAELPELRPIADDWERARYWAGRQVRSDSGRAIRRALQQMERGRYEAALIEAMIAVSAMTMRYLATNAKYATQYRAARRATDGLRALHSSTVQHAALASPRQQREAVNQERAR